MTQDELKEKIASTLTKSFDAIAATVAAAPAPAAPAPAAPAAAPQVDMGALAGTMSETISKAITDALAPVNTAIEELRTDVAKANTPPETPETATARVTEAAVAVAKEMGLNAEDVTITIKESRKGTGGTSDEDTAAQLQKIKDDENAASDETLDEQLAKASPEERKEALGSFFKHAIGS